MPVAASARAPSIAVPLPQSQGADWCHHGGAPLVGEPIVDSSGRVYFATVDGYLHAYEADGRYRFSYTVNGTPLGQPTMRQSDGAILLGTTRRLVYAINQRGGLAWKRRTTSAVWSGLHPLEQGSVAYIGLDRRLYALSDRGTALYRVPIPGKPVGEPVVAARGVVWIPVDTGLARFQRAQKVTRTPIEEPIDQVVPMGVEAIVLAAGRVLLVDPDERVSELSSEGDFVASDGSSAVWFDEQGHGGCRSEQGQVFIVDLATTASAPPRLHQSWLLVPLSSGSVRTIARNGCSFDIEGHEDIVLSSEPLGTPVVSSGWDGLLSSRETKRIQHADPDGAIPGRLVAPTRSGAVCSVVF